MTIDMDLWIALDERQPGEDDGDFVLAWHICQGVFARRREDLNRNRFFSHWRRVPTEGWIDARRRMPTCADGDVTWHCVLTRHVVDGVKVTGWHRVTEDRLYTHWTRLPDPPDGYTEMRKHRGGQKNERTCQHHDRIESVRA